MIFKRVQLYSVSILAVLSLFVSSVSACACAHHQLKVETATPSCHSRSHAAHNETAQNTESTTSIDDACTCFVNIPSPYVLSKSGKQKLTDQNAVTEIPASAHVAEAGFQAVEVDTEPAFPDSNLYLSLLIESMPSRAPPRL